VEVGHRETMRSGKNLEKIRLSYTNTQITNEKHYTTKDGNVELQVLIPRIAEWNLLAPVQPPSPSVPLIPPNPSLHQSNHHDTSHSDRWQEEEAKRKEREAQMESWKIQQSQQQQQQLTSLHSQLSSQQSHLPFSPSSPLSPLPVSSSSYSLPGLSVMPSPAVVILTYNRARYLTETLTSLTSTPGHEHFRLYVSQDGSQPDLTDLSQQFGFIYLRRERKPLLQPDQSATAYLAQHYKSILSRLFDPNQMNHSHVIVIEDDMIFSPDFFTLFIDTADLLNRDPSVFCISSWNDNGFRQLVVDSKRLFRTSYFPGLGWMLRREFWNEIVNDFPLDQWDHFMRLDTTSKGRDCIVPEVSRNHNIGQEGTNMGQSFYSKYLEPIAFNQDPIDSFARPNVGMGYMSGPAYENEMQELFDSAEISGFISSPDVQNRLRSLTPASSPASSQRYLFLYRHADYSLISNQYQLLSNPRGIHEGVIILRLGWHWLIFADVMKCKYLKEAQKFHPDESMKVIKGDQGENCNAVCERAALLDPSAGGKRRCDEDHFVYINECSILKEHFPCERGCRGGVIGPDVPNYVSSSTKPELYQHCLTTDFESNCHASHPTTRRICPCVPF